MDPIYTIDSNGNGKVVFYDWGHSYEAEVKDWKASIPYQPPDGGATLLAQRHVNRFRLDYEKKRCNEIISLVTAHHLSHPEHGDDCACVDECIRQITDTCEEIDNV